MEGTGDDDDFDDDYDDDDDDVKIMTRTNSTMMMTNKGHCPDGCIPERLSVIL